MASGLQSDTKSPEENMKECADSELKELAQYWTLEEAFEDESEWESKLSKKEKHIRALETDVKYLLASCFFHKMRNPVRKDCRSRFEKKSSEF